MTTLSLFKMRHPGLLFIMIALVFLSSFALTGCNQPAIATISSDPIITGNDPIQAPCPEATPYTWDDGDLHLTLTPAAGYAIAALVVSKRGYSGGWAGRLAPVDLALAWGKLANPGYGKHITYSQSGRWYFYHYNAACPWSRSYIQSHSANTHIIPATTNLRMALKQIRRGDAVVLEGYLVNVAGKKGEMPVVWRTSVRRTDQGDGACEVMLVREMRVRGRAYR